MASNEGFSPFSPGDDFWEEAFEACEEEIFKKNRKKAQMSMEKRVSVEKSTPENQENPPSQSESPLPVKRIEFQTQVQEIQLRIQKSKESTGSGSTEIIGISPQKRDSQKSVTGEDFGNTKPNSKTSSPHKISPNLASRGQILVKKEGKNNFIAPVSAQIKAEKSLNFGGESREFQWPFSGNFEGECAPSNLELSYWLPPSVCEIYAKKGVTKLYPWQVVYPKTLKSYELKKTLKTLVIVKPPKPLKIHRKL